MKIEIDELRTAANWGLADLAPALEIYADEQFDTDDGLTVLAGSVEQQDFRHRVIGAVANSVAIFPKIEDIYSTEDSLTNQQATYSAFIRVRGREPIPYLMRFPLAPLHGSQLSRSWTSIKIHASRPIPRRSNEVYTRTQTDAAIQAALAQFRPQSMPSGLAAMVDGEAWVESTDVLVTSRIFAFSMDPGVSGALRVEQADVAEEEGFLIRSIQEGDNGVVVWLLAV